MRPRPAAAPLMAAMIGLGTAGNQEYCFWKLGLDCGIPGFGDR